MLALRALALNGFREARRNRVTLVAVLFALALLFSSVLILEVTVFTFERMVTDIGLGSMSIMLVLLAIFLSTGQLSKEIERRTIFLMMSRPISRGLFVLGRAAGNVLTLWTLLAMMSALFFLQLVLMGFPLRQPQLIAILGLAIELLVLTSFGFVMSSFSSQLVSALVTTGIFFAGHLAADIYQLATRSKSAALGAIGKVVYYLLPNLDRLNFRPQASYQVPVAWEELLKSSAYGLAWSGALLVLAILLFNRRDFK